MFILHDNEHYKKKVFRWLFFTIMIGYICQGMLLFIYVIYASVKKSLKLSWHLHMLRLFLFLPMMKSLLVWHMSIFFHFCQGWIQHMSRFLDLMSRLTCSSVKVATTNVKDKYNMSRFLAIAMSMLGIGHLSRLLISNLILFYYNF